MSNERHSMLMSGNDFFEPGIPVYINRSYETFDLREHAHEFIEITYVSEGEGVHYIAGESVPVEQGTICYIPEGHSHIFRPRTMKKDRPLIVYNCLFRTDYLTELRASFPPFEEIVTGYLDSGLRWFEIKDKGGEYHALFRELFREYTGRQPGFLAVLAALIVRILAGMHRHRQQGQIAPGAKPQWLSIEEAITYIDLNYASELRLTEIAAQASLSQRQFSRLFQRQTGMSFTVYVQNVRMRAACQLLISSKMQVSDIASAVGYADLKHFHLLFMRKIGQTPLTYRNMNK